MKRIGEDVRGLTDEEMGSVAGGWFFAVLGGIAAGLAIADKLGYEPDPKVVQPIVDAITKPLPLPK